MLGGRKECVCDMDVMYSLLATHYKNPPLILIEGRTKMKHIVFEYIDRYTGGEWRRQECYMRSVEECIRVYGLGKDCSYRIISVEDAE